MSVFMADCIRMDKSNKPEWRVIAGVRGVPHTGYQVIFADNGRTHTDSFDSLIIRSPSGQEGRALGAFLMACNKANKEGLVLDLVHATDDTFEHKLITAELAITAYFDPYALT